MLIENQTYLSTREMLDWETKMVDILPEWQLSDEYASEHAQVVDLMGLSVFKFRLTKANEDGSHADRTAGASIQHGVGPFLAKAGVQCRRQSRDHPPSDTVEKLRYLSFSTEIRRRFQYNNIHYVALSHIVPTLTGTSFTDFVDRHILDRLGMTDTRYNLTAATATGRRSDGFTRIGRNLTRCAERWEGVNKIDKSCLGETRSLGWWRGGDSLDMAGPGGLMSTRE